MASNKMYTPLFGANKYLQAREPLQTMMMIMMIIKKSPAIIILTKKKCLSFLIFIFISVFNIHAFFVFFFSLRYIIIQYEIYSYGRKDKHLSYTYTIIALDTRFLAQPNLPSQIELSSPLIQKSCNGLIRGLIRGPIFFCPALPSS